MHVLACEQRWRTESISEDAKMLLDLNVTEATSQSPMSQNSVKRFRRVATRYDKLQETFFGFVCLASSLIVTT